MGIPENELIEELKKCANEEKEEKEIENRLKNNKKTLFDRILNLYSTNLIYEKLN